MSSVRLSPVFKPFAIKALPAIALAAQLGGCAGGSPTSEIFVTADDQECLARVMYFESNRSSEDGMLAVGTVVMNRIDSGRYPSNVCGVVGQKNQFAPGALSKPVDEARSIALARRVAGSVLRGQRHPQLAKRVMFFHTAGYHYPYTNMRYVLAAGGNVFYYKDNQRYGRVAAARPRDPRLLAYASKIAPEASTAFTVEAMTSQPQAAAVAEQPVAAVEQVAAAQPADAAAASSAAIPDQAATADQAPVAAADQASAPAAEPALESAPLQPR